MLGTILGIIGTVASLVGLYALYQARQYRRVKALIYEGSEAIPLATASGIERDYELSIHFRPRGASPTDEEVIDGAFVTYLRFANFGKEPIRAEDIPAANPLTIRATGDRVLDISLSASRRSVSRVQIESVSFGDDLSEAALKFDFLDYHDGGVIRVLSAGPHVEVSLTGDIIGMPAGIGRAETEGKTVEVKGWGLAAWATGELVAFGIAAYLIKLATGSWVNSWLLVVPIVAFAVPLILALVASAALHRGRSFPDELRLPTWAYLGFPDARRLDRLPLSSEDEN